MRALLTLLLILAIPFNAVFAAGERLCDELGRFSGHTSHVGHHLDHPARTLNAAADMPPAATPQAAEQTTLAVAINLADHHHPVPGSKACYDHCHAHAHGSAGWLTPGQLQLPQAPQQLRHAGAGSDAFSSIQLIPPERPPRFLPLIHTA